MLTRCLCSLLLLAIPLGATYVPYGTYRGEGGFLFFQPSQAGLTYTIRQPAQPSPEGVKTEVEYLTPDYKLGVYLGLAYSPEETPFYGSIAFLYFSSCQKKEFLTKEGSNLFTPAGLIALSVRTLLEGRLRQFSCMGGVSCPSSCAHIRLAFGFLWSQLQSKVEYNYTTEAGNEPELILSQLNYAGIGPRFSCEVETPIFLFHNEKLSELSLRLSLAGSFLIGSRKIESLAALPATANLLIPRRTLPLPVVELLLSLPLRLHICTLDALFEVGYSYHLYYGALLNLITYDQENLSFIGPQVGLAFYF